MKKSAIPVEAFYFLAYLILMSLAGATLYFYIEAQSMGPNYRISAASILEESESLKKLIDQERLFVLETVIFFLGSQGGVVNIEEYNTYNISLMPLDSAALNCIDDLKELNKGQYPPKEIITRCIENPNYYDFPESLGVWKCDDYLYSYSYCDFSDFANYNDICCESSDGNIGFNCKESCLRALGYLTDANQICAEKIYCGALWCRENNLQIPETYSGVQYYYKIGEKYPGYFCPSILSYNPELNYEGQGVFWEGLDKNSIINNLIELSNAYFYMPNPAFTSYISRIYGRDMKVAFQLNYRGCTKDACEFSWVPYTEPAQSFEARGIGGIPMVQLSSEILSIQSINIPLLDMVDFSREIIGQRIINDYFADAIEDNLVSGDSDLSQNTLSIYPKEWKSYFSKYSGSPLQGIQDNSSCGENWQESNDYECLMQQVSTKLYSATSNPMNAPRDFGMNYSLRPVFNFAKSSLGVSIKINECPNAVCEYGETTANCPSDCPTGFGTMPNINSAICPAYNIYMMHQTGLTCDNYETYNYKFSYSQESENCLKLLKIQECELDICPNGYCDLSEDYLSCQTDCINLKLDNPNICGDGYLADGEDCLTDEIDYKEFEATLDSGNYSIFISGENPTGEKIQGEIELSGKTFYFNIEAEGEYYGQAKIYDDQIGQCSYNEYSPEQSLDYYGAFGCCSQENYSNGYCNEQVIQNDYCSLINNGYGRSQIGSSCLISNAQGGNIDYSMNQFQLTQSQTINLILKNLNGSIDRIEILRVNYDNTFPIEQKTINSISMNFGGSTEYYTTSEDCTSAIGADFKSYDSFTNNELWYSALCLRSKGKNWMEIAENYTSLFNNFKNKLGESERQKIDNFIKKYRIEIAEESSRQKIIYHTDGCSPNCETQLSSGEIIYNEKINDLSFSKENEFLSESISQEFNTFAEEIDKLVEDRLRAIKLSTSYLSLPIKWVFAYNDKIRIDASNTQSGVDSSCELEYDDEKSFAPDCGCKSNCMEESMCYFDFNNIEVNALRQELYNFEGIFINNDYRDNGVVE